MESTSPELAVLREKLEAEESAYAEMLASVDRLASFTLPAEALPAQPEQMRRLNELWRQPDLPSLSPRLWGRAWRRVWAFLAPRFERQQDFNSLVVQVLNGQLEQTARLHAHLRDVVGALVRYFQRLLPVIDARDRMTSALATTRAELILEAFDRRQQSLAQRLEGLLALRDRVETLTEETHAIARALSQAAPTPEQAHAASLGAEDSVYVAFENRYRGSREELRERLVEYVDMFRDLGPVVDVGCGRGEFLELLRDAGVSARGVDANASAVGECQARGLDVSQGDLMPYVERLSDGAVGGLFAAQVAEHLPPSVLMALLRESYRALRRGGLLVLETVNPRSVVGFFDLYTRDLTHERPLHPDTLSFLAAAAGFSETRILWRAPVEPAAQLQRIPTDGLPEAAAQLLNENVARLNGLLYAPQEYALLARR